MSEYHTPKQRSFNWIEKIDKTKARDEKHQELFKIHWFSIIFV